MTDLSIAKRNGNAPQPPAPKPPQDDGYRAHVEATFGRYEAVLKERNEFSEQLAKALNVIKAATETETLLRDEIASLRRQLEDANLRCLEAMAKYAAIEMLCSNVMAIMREANIPAVPLVREAQGDAPLDPT